jgi:hypothetical protein
MNLVRKLHIVAFNVPSPPDYGGVIDVFYKLKSLVKQGIKVYLHCFEYGRAKDPELERICEKVYYYPRNSGFIYTLQKLPYIVTSRNSSELLENLLLVKAPILFEGLHTCYFINYHELAHYRKIVRMHNVEHQYYSELAKAERNIFKKIYFQSESKKLLKFEKSIDQTNTLVSISPADQEYFKNHNFKSNLIPAFHPNESITSKPGKGVYFLFHGNLGVAENKKAVSYLLSEVFNDLDIPLIVAGKNPENKLMETIQVLKNVTLVPNPSFEKMEKLINDAHGCIIPTFQATGLKLKLLASLYSGRFCITNHTMVNHTGLEKLCIIANNPEQMKKAIVNCFLSEFGEKDILIRKKILESEFSNKIKTKRLISLIFNEV